MIDLGLLPLLAVATSLAQREKIEITGKIVLEEINSGFPQAQYIKLKKNCPCVLFN
jgi:hypothetical protein